MYAMATVHRHFRLKNRRGVPLRIRFKACRLKYLAAVLLVSIVSPHPPTPQGIYVMIEGDTTPVILYRVRLLLTNLVWSIARFCELFHSLTDKSVLHSMLEHIM